MHATWPLAFSKMLTKRVKACTGLLAESAAHLDVGVDRSGLFWDGDDDTVRAVVALIHHLSVARVLVQVEI